MKTYPSWIKIKKCKKIYTQDVNGKDNGFLVDVLNRNDAIFKERLDEKFQQVYYSTVYKNMFKGFHIHMHKIDTVTSLIGKFLLVIYPHIIEKSNLDVEIDFSDLIIIPVDTEEDLYTITFESKYPHGYFGVSDIAYVLNYRTPAWDPSDNYQYDYKFIGIEEKLMDWLKNNEDC